MSNQADSENIENESAFPQGDPAATGPTETVALHISEDGSDDEDTYFDGPYLVFTEAYHLKRGYCCESGCRHCPYGFADRVKGE